MLKSTLIIPRIEFYYDGLDFLYGKMYVDFNSKCNILSNSKLVIVECIHCEAIHLINNENFTNKFEITFKKLKFELELHYDNKIISEIFDFTNIKPLGFSKESGVETKNGTKQIKSLKIGDLVYNSYGKVNKLDSLIVFYLKQNQKIFAINIKKNICGLHIPREDFILSVNTNLKIKKRNYFGRQLYLSKKASQIENNPTDSFIELYNLKLSSVKLNSESYGFNPKDTNQGSFISNYFINGFVVDSFNLQ